MKKISFTIIILLLLGGCSTKEEGTNNRYLIPNGYEGSILVLYNVSDQPALKKEGKSTVIPVQLKNLEALNGTELQQYGISLTSTNDMKYGTVNDKFFYIDEKGKRTALDERCTHVSENGSFTGESGKEIKYQEIQITNSNCGEEFHLNGEDRFDSQAKEVKSYWMNKFD